MIFFFKFYRGLIIQFLFCFFFFFPPKQAYLADSIGRVKKENTKKKEKQKQKQSHTQIQTQPESLPSSSKLSGHGGRSSPRHAHQRLGSDSSLGRHGSHRSPPIFRLQAPAVLPSPRSESRQRRVRPNPNSSIACRAVRFFNL